MHAHADVSHPTERAGVIVTEWLTIQQAAQRVGRSSSTIYRWVDQHGLPRLLGRIPVRELLNIDRKMKANKMKGSNQ